MNRPFDASGQKITLRHEECVKVVFYTTGEIYGSVGDYCDYYVEGRGGDYYVEGRGEVCVRGPAGEAVLEFGVGGPSEKTQAIFRDYYGDVDAALTLRDEHGICVNRQGKDTRIRRGKEVLGDIAFIDPSP